MPDTAAKAAEAAGHVLARVGEAPRLGIILGSGLGALANRLSEPVIISYTELPNFPIPTVKGHEGNLVAGRLAGVSAVVMQGRFHHYEGYYMRDITFPVRVLSALGTKALIVTNASGGINASIAPGDFMAVSDHINMIGTNPLVGIVDEGGGSRDRFLDLTHAYDGELLEIAHRTADEKGIRLSEGVLAAVSGPCYETPAEVRMLRALGVDAVCMSSVPEVIMARYLGMRALCISLVTNRAAGLSDKGPDHEEVLDMAESRSAAFSALIEGVAGMAERGIV